MTDSDGSMPSSEDPGYVAMPSGVMFGMGWTRFLPASSVMIFAAVSATGAPTLAEIAEFADSASSGLGVHAPAWDEPQTWTEDSLRDYYEDYPPDDNERQTPGEANAEAAAEHAARIADMDRYAAGLGVAAVRTIEDLVGFMTACGLLTVSTESGDVRYSLNPAPPLPGEVLRLTADEQAKEDRLRWEDLHESTAQDIIRLFTSAEAGHPASKRTSLQRLAHELGLDVETTRAGLATLVSDPDFTVTHDPETLAEHKVFEIHVDWELFGATRMSFQLGTPTE